MLNLNVMSSLPLFSSRILLGVSGGIAVYKSADLCRQLIKAGAEVQVIMTRSATEFVAPLTFETLSGRPVYNDMFERAHAWEIEHVAFARWGQVLVIAPATANTIAKMAAGIADDPLTTTVLAFRGPVVIVPAMNTAMWEHPQTQANIQHLRTRGVRMLQPESGYLACGEEGAGRLPETTKIITAIEVALAATRPTGPLLGKKVLITAGPTVEPIDPVRYISNPSSGRMGFALAAEAARLGAEVTLVAGPTQIAPPTDLTKVIRIRTTEEMRTAVLAELPAQDICVFCAAPADFAPESPASKKIKKNQAGETVTLKLVRTPDIAAEANAMRKPNQTFIGFAAETNDLLAHAQEKMGAKGFDIVIANEVSAENPAFAALDNAITLLTRAGERIDLPRAPKETLATQIWEQVIKNQS